jgi:DNA invertase Pin-like site-specific DNA recombinase
MSFATQLAPLPPQAVGAYLRVSTGEQHTENQQPDVERWLAARHPGAEIHWYREKASATKDKRPIFRQMLADAGAGRINVLVVWKIDRFGRSLGRNVHDFLELEKSGVRVESVTESWLTDTTGPIRSLLLAIFSWVAEQEVATLKERVGAAFQRIDAAGGTRGTVRFGLRIERGEDGIPRAALDPAALPSLTLMAQLFLASQGSLRGTALTLNARPAAQRLGGTFDHKRVRFTLLDERLRALGAWSPQVIAEIDAKLAALPKARPRGAATPVHLASPFIACASCGGSLTVKNRTASSCGARYMCGKCATGGRGACVGIGTRPEPDVDRALITITRSAITGKVAERALAIARKMLDEAPDAATEREAVAAALEQAESEGKALAVAIRKRGPLEALLDESQANDERKRALRTRLARLDAAPPSLDKRRRLAEIERRLAELGKALDEGGMAARPAVEAVLQGARLTATPVLVAGEKRWSLSGCIPGGYLLGATGEGSTGPIGGVPDGGVGPGNAGVEG